MEHILVTGALGFIGSAYIRAHGGKGLVALARRTNERNAERLEALDVPTYTLDLARDDLSDVMNEVETVVHLAAKTFVDRSITDPMPFFESNVLATFRLLEAMRRSRTVRKLLYFTTDEEYGAILKGAYKEDARINPSNPYAATKAAGTALALSYVNTYGLDIVISRCENVYGPYQGPEKVLPTFTRKALADEPLPVYGDGHHRRQWIHVHDVCRAIDHLLSVGEGGEIYHIAGHQELENLELAEMVLRVLEKPLDRIQMIPDHNLRPGHDRRYALDTTKIRASGWAPAIPVEEGMAQVVRWYANNRWWTG